MADYSTAKSSSLLPETTQYHMLQLPHYLQYHSGEKLMPYQRTLKTNTIDEPPYGQGSMKYEVGCF